MTPEVRALLADDEATIEAMAKQIWLERPDCKDKPWPIQTDRDRRAYSHNPVAAADLCFIYARAALAALRIKADAAS